VIRKLRGKGVLWLAHRVELLRQARTQLIAAGLPESAVGMLSGTETVNPDAWVLVASVDMFRTREVPRADLIVVDEAHHVKAKSYMAVINARPKAQVIGLTATPERLDGEALGDVFKHLHTIAEALELIADGHLLKSVVYGIPREKARALVKGVGKSGKDYSSRKLEGRMKKSPLMADIVKERQRLAAGKPTIVYACTRAHGREIAARFKRAKVATAYLDAETPASEREALLGPKGKLASGAIEVVVNVGVLTEGFDCPPVSCIVVARPTKSLVLWRQMCGRGARPMKGKRYIVLDHAGNIWRHGFPDDPIEWSLDGRDGGEKRDAPWKCCAECAAMIPAGALECPECGAELSASERDLAEQQEKLERLRRSEAEKAAIEKRIHAFAVKAGAPPEWLARALRELAA
jgi:DNA repair protein RadD